MRITFYSEWQQTRRLQRNIIVDVIQATKNTHVEILYQIALNQILFMTQYTLCNCFDSLIVWLIGAETAQYSTTLNKSMAIFFFSINFFRNRSAFIYLSSIYSPNLVIRISYEILKQYEPNWAGILILQLSLMGSLTKYVTLIV